jgi:hypothetical protein
MKELAEMPPMFLAIRLAVGHVASRDPVPGSVGLVMLRVFAAMAWLRRR